ncbi:MAG: glycine dehydrogenase, partial [Candidatus Bathyarchaeia archaeon]
MDYSYFPNEAKSIQERMLRTIGVASIEDLFRDIPHQLRLQSPLKLPHGDAEAEVRSEIEQTLNKSLNTRRVLSFLGGGVWQHYVPAVVDYLAERSEFLTSYTPYQAEVSQGLLQVLFEFQSLICELMEMDVANCGMYDWASALGEAARMSMRTTQRNSILVPRFIHPERLRVLKAYTEPTGARIVEIQNIPTTGQIALDDLKS